MDNWFLTPSQPRRSLQAGRSLGEAVIWSVRQFRHWLQHHWRDAHTVRTLSQRHWRRIKYTGRTKHTSFSSPAVYSLIRAIAKCCTPLNNANSGTKLNRTVKVVDESGTYQLADVLTVLSCHKCCQLVLTNRIMVNTYTKIKVNICPTSLHKFRYKIGVIPESWRHVAHYVIGCAWKKNGSTARTNSILHFLTIQTWGCSHPTVPT